MSLGKQFSKLCYQNSNIPVGSSQKKDLLLKRVSLGTPFICHNFFSKQKNLLCISKVFCGAMVEFWGLRGALGLQDSWGSLIAVGSQNIWWVHPAHVCAMPARGSCACLRLLGSTGVENSPVPDVAREGVLIPAFVSLPLEVGVGGIFISADSPAFRSAAPLFTEPLAMFY